MADAALQYERAVAFLSQERWEDAVEAFRSAVRLDGAFVDALHGLAHTLDILGRPEEAVSTYEEVLRLDPRRAVGHCALAVLLENLGRRDEALYHARTGATLAPDDAVCHYNLGVVLHGAADHRGAIAAYKKAMAIAPDYWDSYDNASMCLGELGHWFDAAQMLEEARTRHPMGGTASMLHNLAVALSMSGRREDAGAAARQAIERDPGCAGAYGLLASASAGGGNWAEALHHLRRLFQIRGESATTSDYFNLGVALAETGDLVGASAALETVVSRAPDDIDGLLQLGSVYSGCARHEDAAAILGQAATKHPKVAEAHGLLAVALHNLGRDREAVVAFERAGREDGEYFRRHPTMAALLAKIRHSSSAS